MTPPLMHCSPTTAHAHARLIQQESCNGKCTPHQVCSAFESKAI